MNIGLFFWIPANSDAERQAQALETVTIEARRFERVARHYFPADRVYPHIVLSDNAPSLRSSTSKREAIEAATLAETPDLDYYVYWGGRHSSYCGQAARPGDTAIVYTPFTCKFLTMIHECKGHSHGLGHNNVLDADGVERVYAGRHIMGGGAGRKGFGADHIAEIWQPTFGDLVRPFRWGPADVSQEVYLRPLECEVEALSTAFNGVRAGGVWLFHHTTRGHVDAVRDVYEGRIIVNQFRRSDGASIKVAELYPGEAYQEGATLIEYREYRPADRTAKLRITLDGNTPEETEWPSLFGDPPEDAEPVVPGYFGDPQYPSEGLDIQTFPELGIGTVFGYTYGIDADDKEFYFGSFPLDDQSAIFTLWSSEGGTFNDDTRPGPGAAEEYEIGQARIYRQGDRVVLCRNTTEYGIGADVMEPIELPADLVGLGAWSTRPKEGMTLARIGADLLTGFLWTYGPARRNHFGVPVEGTTSRWFIIQAERTDGDQFEGIFKEVAGEDLYWRTFYKGEELPVGRCTFDLDDIDQGRIACDYEINSPSGVAGQGRWNMTPVVE